VCYQSPQIGCVFVAVNSINSVNILSLFPPGSVLCVSLHGASRFSNNDALFLLCQFCNLRRQFFCIFGLGISVSFLSSLEADGDDSISSSILCGFLTAADISCSVHFLFGSRHYQ
jgi:hypothetical protein